MSPSFENCNSLVQEIFSVIDYSQNRVPLWPYSIQYAQCEEATFFSIRIMLKSCSENLE